MLTAYHAHESLAVEPYLARIGIAVRPNPTRDSLFALQSAHVRHVPYENFDIIAQTPLSLAIPDLYDKIVTRRRGGYCFELNGLFGWLLRRLGYDVTDYFARYLRDEPTLPMRRHRVLGVKVGEETYICDVGVGGPSPQYPILLAPEIMQPQGEECYRIQMREGLGCVVTELRHGEWNDYYSFAREPQLPIDYLTTSYYCEHSPDSPFNKRHMASLRRVDGRVTLAGYEFRVFSPEGVRVFTPASLSEFEKALLEYFQIVL